MRRIWRACSVSVSMIWLLSAAVTMFLIVVAGSVTTICASATRRPIPSSANTMTIADQSMHGGSSNGYG